MSSDHLCKSCPSHLTYDIARPARGPRYHACNGRGCNLEGCGFIGNFSIHDWNNDEGSVNEDSVGQMKSNATAH